MVWKCRDWITETSTLRYLSVLAMSHFIVKIKPKGQDVKTWHHVLYCWKITKHWYSERMLKTCVNYNSEILIKKKIYLKISFAGIVYAETGLYKGKQNPIQYGIVLHLCRASSLDKLYIIHSKPHYTVPNFRYCIVHAFILLQQVSIIMNLYIGLLVIHSKCGTVPNFRYWECLCSSPTSL